MYGSRFRQRDLGRIGFIQPARRHSDSHPVQEIGADIGKQAGPGVSQIGKRGFSFCGYIHSAIRNDGPAHGNTGLNLCF